MSETTLDTETPYCKGQLQEAGRQQIPQLDGVQGNLTLLIASPQLTKPTTPDVGGTSCLTENHHIPLTFLSLFVAVLINLMPWLISPQNNVCLHKSILRGKTAHA